ncbi:MAG: hypothetical protein AAF546_12590 [Verrucomicrobiota bacterium]
MKARLLLLAFLILSSITSSASEELSLGWDSVSLEIPGAEEAGLVSLEIECPEGIWKTFKFECFGESYSLTEKELENLREFPLSSLNTTHEGGWEILGGYTIHFKFHRIYYDEEMNLVRQDVAVSVNKEGYTVSKPFAQNIANNSE